MASLIIGLDCSTTSTKALVFDANGTVVAQAHVPVPLASPRPRWYEQNPADWWRSVHSALKAVAGSLDPTSIRAIAISNQRETFVPLDKNADPLRPAIVWLDERCKDEVEPFAKAVGKTTIQRITGKPPDYAPVVYRLAWMKSHEPELFRKIGMVCDVHAFLVWKLTGFFKTSWASADPFGLLAMKSKRWSPEILAILGMREKQFPAIFRPGTLLGMISEPAARETGLSKDTAIVAGGGDGQCAGLGSNALTPKRAYLNLGTAVVSGVYSSQYRVSKAFRTMCSCTEEGYYCESSLRAGTFTIDWLIRQILNIDPTRYPAIYSELEAEAQSVEAGSDGLLHLPYLCGAMNPYWDMDASGAFVGLTASHRRGHLYRSILEGIAFEQSLTIHALERELGTHVREFVVIGGGAASDLWCHILADVTGKTLLFPATTEASALGAGIAAAVGMHWYPTFGAAAEAMTAVRRTILPDPANQKRYQQMFGVYKKLYPSLRRLGRSRKTSQLAVTR